MNTALILSALLLAPVRPPTPLEIQKEYDANYAANANEKAIQTAVQLKQKRDEAPSLPGAPEVLSGPLAFTFKASDGRTISFQGTGTLTIETPAPIPPPVGTKLSGIRDPATGLLVTTTTAGTRLLLEGENLLSETILVTCGGERSAVLRQLNNVIEFVAPVVPAGKPNVLVLYWLINNNWQEKGRLPLTVTSGGPTPQPPPVVGANPRIDSIQATGDLKVVLTGAGFGAAEGKVLLDKRPMAVLAWADGRIDCRMGQESVFERVVVDLWRPGEGWFTLMWEPLP